ncbi:MULTISPECIES: GNAT family N-acetyltransferase [Brachybacterium]|uniref:GNAT family N-acetyltransferase n=1 Tax=Brachybacterium TaxID=43668 RepID=UPI003FD4F8DC
MTAAPRTPDTRLRLQRSAVADIDPRTLYLLAKLRQDVFSIEQEATDPDLDGRDLEPTTTLLWIEVPGSEADAAGLEGEPAAHVRVLRESDGSMRIGRMAVRAQERRAGFGGRIMRAALDLTAQLAPEQPVHIDGQAYLETWYQGMGFETVGPVFLEAGIEHVPMVFRHPSD